jgi:hypothetical protein
VAGHRGAPPAPEQPPSTIAGRRGHRDRQLGTWEYRWARRLNAEDLDAGLLMWDVQRNVRASGSRPGASVQFRSTTQAGASACGGWCWSPMGWTYTSSRRASKVDLESDVRTLTLVWLGDLPIGEALRNRAIRLEGPRPLREGFPRWLALTPFAATPLHERSVRPPLQSAAAG